MSEVQQVNAVPVEKKRAIRKKIVKPKVAEEPPAATTEEPTQDNEDEHHDENDLRFVIPSSRIKNYINKEKLNKEIDQLIENIKKNGESLDLNSLVSEDMQKKIGNILKEKEEKGETDININTVTIEVLSKSRYKFSNTSFKVLSVFADMMIEEITQCAMADLIKHKKSIINSKYVFNDEIKNCRLYKIFSSLSTFTSFKTDDASATDEDTTAVDDATEAITDMSVSDTHEKKINFEFYIKRICNKIKTSNEEFSNVKVSEKYQKFCSNLILDFLDRVAPLAKIILEVMATKTITNKVFQTVIKTQLWDVPAYEEIIDELNKRLEDSQKKKPESNGTATPSAETPAVNTPATPAA